MIYLRKIISLLFILLIIVPAYIPDARSQGISQLKIDKIISPQRVLEGETIQITISLTGEGDASHSEVDVVLTLDRSGSMSGSKITDAKNAAKTFLDYTDDNDRAGLITFSKNVKIESDLEFMNSTYRELLKTEIDSFKEDPAGITNIYEAIVTANDLLLASPRGDVLLVNVLLTDGRHNYPSLEDEAFESLANDTKEEGIIIYTIGLGEDVDSERLQMFADLTGGEYFFAPTSEELEDIFVEIAGKLAIAGTDITVSETIPYYLSYNNDSSKVPNETSENSDTILEWDVGTIWINEVWEVTYSVEAGEAVDTSNLISHTQIKYTTAEGNPVTIHLTPGLVFHDIAIIQLVVEPVRVTRGDTIDISATVESKSFVQDTFNVETRLNDTLLDSQTLTLEPGQSKNVSFTWNTSDIEGGRYNLIVTADPTEIIWEQDKTDNTAMTEVEISSGAISPMIFYLAVILFLILASSAVAGSYFFKKVRKTRTTSPTCLRCGSYVTYVSHTRRWYCARCRRYIR